MSSIHKTIECPKCGKEAEVFATSPDFREAISCNSCGYDNGEAEDVSDILAVIGPTITAASSYYVN